MIDIVIINDAMTAQMINTALPTGLMSSTSFKWSNDEIITMKILINVPTNESIANTNLSRISHMTILPPRFYTIQHLVGRNQTIF
jgi:hypothetical protein